MIEAILALIIIGFGILYYFKKGDTSMHDYVIGQASDLYDKISPYSFRQIREKVKDMGQEYTKKEYTVQVIIFSGVAFGVSYLYFYNMIISIIYVCVVIAIIPYLTYLRCKRIFSEFLFEQIQVYTTNTIMEFQTTQNFVKAIEGVWSSGVLESPVKDDVKYMIEMAYKNGDINESIEFMNKKYE